MPPRSATRRFAPGFRIATGIALRRRSIIGRVVAVLAPFVDIFTHGVESKSIGWRCLDYFRADPPTLGIIGTRDRWIVAPCIFGIVDAAARGALPLSFCRQAKLRP